MAIGKMMRGEPIVYRHLRSLTLALCTLTSISAAAVGRAQTSAPPKPAAAPALQLVDLAGYQQFLAKYRGKPVLVTFWATWCEPCRDEYPMIVKLAAQYAPQGLAVFGVDMDDDADMNLVRHFMTQNHPGFPNVRQKPGIDLDAFYQGVNPEWHGTMPETVFYGRDGRIVTSFVGEKTHDDFERAIHLILSK
jgi:thiol-disulfide isomerase/thioredoxin